MRLHRTKQSRHARLQRRITRIVIVLSVPVIIFILFLKPLPIGQDSVAPVKTLPKISTQKPVIGFPMRLIIPVINVNAIIAYAGLTSDGAMAIKADPNEVAWYDRGPRPGENGNAVIAGHYGFLNGKGSVFNDLHTLQVGDRLSVVDDRNVSTNFVVRESRTYSPTADASSVFTTNDGHAHLNLITCEGTWNNAQDSYSDRRVIFTDKVTP